MSDEPNTRIQWTMKLSDAALISDTLRQAAEEAESQANYLAGERYAESERDRYMAAPREEGERRQRRDWKLSDADQERIVAHRARAANLRRLVES